MSKSKFLTGVVFKTSNGYLPSGCIRVNIHVRFDLDGGVSKSAKVKLRSCSFVSGHKFLPNIIPTLPSIIPLLLIRFQVRLTKKLVNSSTLVINNDHNLSIDVAEKET